MRKHLHAHSTTSRRHAATHPARQQTTFTIPGLDAALAAQSDTQPHRCTDPNCDCDEVELLPPGYARALREYRLTRLFPAYRGTSLDALALTLAPGNPRHLLN